MKNTFGDQLDYLNTNLRTKMIKKRDTRGSNCNFDILRDEYDSKMHFQKPKWWYAHKRKILNANIRGP
jgi:hypothetical protein